MCITTIIRIRLFSVTISCFISFLGYSQEQQHEGSLMSVAIKAKAQDFKQNPNFNMAQNFFNQSNWDSTLVYSMKEISNSTNKEIVDYCHYFRGISFKEKKLLDESKKEFKKISHNFQFFYKVKMKLGEIALEQNDFKNALQYFREIEKIKNKGSCTILDCVTYILKNSINQRNICLKVLNYSRFRKILFC